MREIKLTLNHLIEIDYDEVISIVKNFIAEYFNKVRANSLVVGLSGGIDSSTLLALVSESIPRIRSLA